MNLHKSRIFLICLLAFIAGVGLGSLWQADILIWYAGLMASIIFLALGWQNKKIRIISLWGLFFILGVARLLVSIPSDADETHIKYYNDQNVVIRGVIAQEPDVRVDHQKLTVSVRNDNEEGLSGRLLVKTDLYKTYQYGDLLEISCLLRKPEPIEDFAYDKYLARYDIYSVCWRPEQIVKVDTGQGNPILAGIFFIKTRFMRSINNILGEPYSAFLAGLLVGARRGIPQYLLDAFNRAGLTHIIAISGTNITIIAAVIISFLDALGVGRRKAFWHITAGIVIFVIMTGATASVIRAGIMGILVLLATQMGRMSRATNAIFLTAFIMMLINPKILVFDAGFELSFLATMGLVYINPIMQKLTRMWPRIFGVKGALITTMSAIIMTTPLIIYQFGRLSVVAPLANILILPIIPLTMALGFVSGILGLAWTTLGRILAWPVWLLLQYMIRVSEILSAWRFAAIDLGGFHWILMIALYGVIGVGVWKLGRISANPHH